MFASSKILFYLVIASLALVNAAPIETSELEAREPGFNIGTLNIPLNPKIGSPAPAPAPKPAAPAPIIKPGTIKIIKWRDDETLEARDPGFNIGTLNIPLNPKIGNPAPAPAPAPKPAAPAPIIKPGTIKIIKWRDTEEDLEARGSNIKIPTPGTLNIPLNPKIGNPAPAAPVKPATPAKVITVGTLKIKLPWA